MLCSSLRKRSGWGTVVPGILADKYLKWRETQIGSHDVAFPVHRPGKRTRTFRISLFTITDIETLDGRERLKTLSQLNGGTDIAAIVLVGETAGVEPGENSQGHSMGAFLKLQVEIAMDLPITLLPLVSPSHLHETLNNLRKQMNWVHGHGPEQPATREPMDDMSRRVAQAACCVIGNPLSQKQARVLCEISNSLKDLAEKAMSTEGQALLRRSLGERDADRVVEFFEGGPRLI